MIAKDKVEADWAQTHEGMIEEIRKWGGKYDVKRNRGQQPLIPRVLIIDLSHSIGCVIWKLEGMADLQQQRAVAGDVFTALRNLAGRLRAEVEQ